MGNQQPKKITKVNKTQIEVASMKSKYHLELMLGRKNAEIIKSQKELVAKIKSGNRNKIEEILIAERIVNALKYTQACNYLMSYCASLKPQANFIAENLYNPEKLKPYLGMIYSLIYAAENLGLSSLKEFRDLMRALNDPSVVSVYVSQQIKDLLSPHPSPAELNQYFIEMSERNQIPLQQINIVGHRFTKNLNEKPSNQPTFSELEKMIAAQLSKNMGNNTGFGGNGGYGGYGGQNGPNVPNGQGWSGGQGGFNGSSGQGGFNGPNGQGWQGGSIGQQGWQGGNNVPLGPGNSGYVPQGYQPVNKVKGPQIYTPANISASKDLPNPYSHQIESKMSIKDINDIGYYPEIVPEPAMKIDPDFNALCDKIRVGL